MPNYDIAEDWDNLSLGQKARVINLASKEQLEKWASDPECNQRIVSATGLKAEDNAAKPAEVPFYRRTEVSADARYIAGRIIKHLWIIFVALPFVLAILFLLLRS
jgi:hypothetical protein